MTEAELKEVIQKVRDLAFQAYQSGKEKQVMSQILMACSSALTDTEPTKPPFFPSGTADTSGLP